MKAREADQLLDAAEATVPAFKASLVDSKRLLESCLAADIPARISSDPSCSSCGPQVTLEVRAEDVPRLAALLQESWHDSIAREGVAAVASGAAAEHDEPPCPACGATAALVDGACPDCGLALS
ncbi:MAG: hypothetical protein IT370_03830 [Deltaproteobacteria bacterium]|nr:hypothetical protein [Deltaproteobacteria bacterium]